ncbi:transmembrane protein 179B [Clupea harengus]|uniref:Transmembrane protein 179B n=1 Tax=Clupea harengus TaxID=7950 RepID=A0A6P3VNW0_CLUHA|nr:transmembrane protein 179B [Clupea harengus]
MALPLLLLLELAIYTSCFICGIVTAALVTIVQGHSGGKCLLYGTLQYNASAKVISVTSSSHPSLCYFVSAISVCVAIFCFSLTLYWVYSCCLDGEVSRERLWLNVTLGMCGVFLFFLLITGCILKIGTDKLCDSIQPSYPSCEDAQNIPWASPDSGSKFYSSLRSAEASVWVNFFFWLIIGGLAFAQRRKGNAEYRGGGEVTGASPSETEPFLQRPGQP